jgi:hypothetical protein
VREIERERELEGARERDSEREGLVLTASTSASHGFTLRLTIRSLTCRACGTDRDNIY